MRDGHSKPPFRTQLMVNDRGLSVDAGTAAAKGARYETSSDK